MKQISQQLQNLQPTSLNSTIVKPQTAKPTQMTELSQKFKEIQFQNSGSLTTDNVNVREYNSSIISNKNSENLMKLIWKQFEKNDPRVLQVQESQFYKRNYEQSEEIVRDIHYRNLVKKDHNYYRAVEDNLWNVPTRLSPKYCQYSKYSDVYKKSPRNLDKILAKQIDEETQENLKKVQRQKSQSHARYFKRKIERDIIEYKSQQRQKKEIQKEVEIFESQEPEIFDELAMKMRWTHVQKDPTKGLKDLQTFRLDSLNLVNHLPQEKVDKIVTSKVLKFDQDSCKMILENILKEQQTKDFKMNSQKIDREQLRKRLKTSHNKTLDIEEKCGLSQSFNSDVKRKPYQNLNQYSNSIMTGVRDLRSNTEQILNLENPEKEQFTQTQNLDGTVSMKLKYVQPKKYIRSDHTEALSIYKPEFNSKDFFAKSDFRGLILADHQEAIGPKAFKCVEELNDQVLSKFKTLQNFNQQLQQNKTIKSFYQEVLIPKIYQLNQTQQHSFTENKDQTQKSFQQKADKSLNKTSGDISFGQVTSRSQEKHVAFTPKPQIKHIDESRVIEMEQQRLFTFQKQNDSVKNEQQALISVRGRERSVVDKQFSFNQKRSQTSFNQRRNIANIINGGGQVNYVMKENQIAQQNQNSFFLTDNYLQYKSILKCHYEIFYRNMLENLNVNPKFYQKTMLYIRRFFLKNKIICINYIQWSILTIIIIVKIITLFKIIKLDRNLLRGQMQRTFTKSIQSSLPQLVHKDQKRERCRATGSESSDEQMIIEDSQNIYFYRKKLVESDQDSNQDMDDRFYYQIPNKQKVHNLNHTLDLCQKIIQPHPNKLSHKQIMIDDEQARNQYMDLSNFARNFLANTNKHTLNTSSDEDWTSDEEEEEEEKEYEDEEEAYLAFEREQLYYQKRYLYKLKQSQKRNIKKASKRNTQRPLYQNPIVEERERQEINESLSKSLNSQDNTVQQQYKPHFFNSSKLNPHKETTQTNFIFQIPMKHTVPNYLTKILEESLQLTSKICGESPKNSTQVVPKVLHTIPEPEVLNRELDTGNLIRTETAQNLIIDSIDDINLIHVLLYRGIKPDILLESTRVQQILSESAMFKTMEHDIRYKLLQKLINSKNSNQDPKFGEWEIQLLNQLSSIYQGELQLRSFQERALLSNDINSSQEKFNVGLYLLPNKQPTFQVKKRQRKENRKKKKWLQKMTEKKKKNTKNFQ